MRPAKPYMVDEGAFGEWVRPHLVAMARLAARLGPPESRDDVVQEALTRAWQKRHQFDAGRGSVRTWLLAITADRARKQVPRRPLPLIVRNETNLSTTEARMDIERAVSGLSARQRMAIDCFYFVGLTVAETAVVMKCTEGTVKSTLADARAKLRLILGSDEW